MLELTSLTFNNIRCFITPQTISFENRDKLIQVDGLVESTGGSSGAGKTTLFMSLDYLLGINDLPVTLLQSRLTKDTIDVSGDFRLNGKPLTIKRSKKSGLTINLDGDITSGNSKLAEEKLDEIIGIPRKIFNRMVHKRQKEGGFFLDMTAKEMYEFLVEILNLGRYIKESESISLGIETNLKKIESLESESNALSESIKSLQLVLNQKTKPDVDLATLEQQIEALGKQRAVFSDMLGKTQLMLGEEVEMLHKPLKPIIEKSDTTTLEALKQQLIEANEKHTQTTNALNVMERKWLNASGLIDKSKEIGVEITKLREQITHIESSSCPTCKQRWSGDSATQEIERLKTQSKALIDQVLENKKEIDRIPEHLANKSRLQSMLEELLVQCGVVQESVTKETADLQVVEQKQQNEFLTAETKYNLQLVEIKNKHTPEIERVKQEINNTDNKIFAFKTQQQSAQLTLEDYTREVKSLNKMIEAKSIKTTVVIFDIGEIKKAIVVSEETSRLIKTYVLHTFQETLDLIGEMSTEFLSAIPNMQTSTIYFEGCKETKTGSLKNEVSAVISIDGNDKVPIKSLSGGERTSIDLAVDLAVIDIIESKTNKGANFFIIDEPFDGLDSVCKENCLEILRQVDTNKKIIMVDHSSELKEMVSDIITVVKSGESSKVIA